MSIELFTDPEPESYVDSIKWPEMFARVAIFMRFIVLPLTILLFVSAYFFPNSNSFSFLLTVAGTFLGIVAIWVSLEIFRIGDKISNQQGEILKSYGALIRQVRELIMVSHRHIQAQELRRRVESSRLNNDDAELTYWRFIWRFETSTSLGLLLKPGGFANIRVVGTNIPPLETDLEKLPNPIYTVEVNDVRDNSVLHAGRAYCWCCNGSLQISNSADEIDLHPPFVEFRFATIGEGRIRNIADRPPNFFRLKDLKDPELGIEDQG
jgi:hypothetical protein